MNKKWYYIEKGTAVFLIIWGLLRLYFNILNIKSLKDLSQHSVLFPDISYSTIIFSQHPQIIISLFTFLAGCMLIMSKRTGLILSLSTCLIHIGIVIKALFTYSPEGLNIHGPISRMYFIGGGAILFFLLITVLLIQKPKREQPITLKEYGLSLLISLLFILDSIIY